MSTRLGRIGGVVIAFGALAVVLSGCVFQEPPKAKQIGKKPRVALSFKLCQPKAASPIPNCVRSTFPPEGSQGRVLLGLRVPKGTKAPKRFSSAGGNMTSRFDRDGSYSRELMAKAPTGNQYKWIGYISAVTPPAPNPDRNRVGLRGAFRVDLRVPRRIVGKRFRVTPVLGATAQVPGEIDCGNDPFATDLDEGEEIMCIGDPEEGNLITRKPRIQPRR